MRTDSCRAGVGEPFENEPDAIQITIRMKCFVRVAVILIAFLAFASLAADFWKYFLGRTNLASLVRQFNLDEEANLPTLLSSLALLACSALLFAVRAAKSRDRDPHVPYWTGLGIIFLLMGIDEACEFHETVMQVIWKFYRPGGYLHYVWVVPGIAFVAGVGIAYLRFVFRLPRATRYRFIVSGAVYIWGALGMEMISGKYMDGRSGPDFTSGVLSTIEETLEMAGALMFLRALAKYLGELGFRAAVEFEAPVKTFPSAKLRTAAASLSAASPRDSRAAQG